MKIATWNVNSIRARMEHVTRWLEARQPDVLMMQELKGTDFPADIFKLLGYESAAVTQKSYNGVAILTRKPAQIVSTALPGDEADGHARFLELLLDGVRIVNVYLPNGNPIGSPNYEYKLTWMDRLTQQLAVWRTGQIPTVIGGDFNIVPEDIDCHKPSSWIKDAIFTPQSRAIFRAMLDMGYIDAFRTLHPGETGQFTYWDYFRNAFENNRGVRIDHLLLSPELAGRLTSCAIDRGPRAEPKPSDHAPIMLELD